MASRDLLTDLQHAQRMTVDSSSAIYYLGALDPRGAVARQAFQQAAAGALEVQFAGITQAELLVRPYRERDQLAWRKVMTLLEATPGVRTMQVSRSVLLAAAETRALTGLKTPDALIAASALVHGCDALLGNDRAFARVPVVPAEDWTTFDMSSRAALRYLHLDDYI